MSRIHAPVPPFTLETAIQKVRGAEDGWNTRNPEKVSLAYTIDSKWRNRAEIFQGRQKIVEFLTRKWERELDYRLITLCFIALALSGRARCACRGLLPGAAGVVAILEVMTHGGNLRTGAFPAPSPKPRRLWALL
jgi:hypothetical protein